MPHMTTPHTPRRLTIAASILAAATLSNARINPQAEAMPQTPSLQNRAPLAPAPLLKLPPGAIEPRGWLRHQLQLQADGFHGHLEEISPFLSHEGNAWLSPTGSGQRGWEEVPYWLKGYLGCALVLKDDAMLDNARVWLEGAINSQQPDGWFGPGEGRTGLATNLQGREDLWPNMIMLFCLMDYHEAHPDQRILDLMTRYFRYLEQVPEDKFLVGYWPKVRGGDQLRAIHWLYNRTGEKWLLDLAEKTHRHTARWDEGVINWHNVNIAQGFREPTQWWVQSREERDLAGAQRNWSEVRAKFGQVPGGLFGADENAREGMTDPRQAVETCGMVEAMLSDELLLGITGDMIWADRCEDVAFNSLAAAFTAEMTALRYLTAPNQATSDATNHAPGIQNGGAMYLLSPHQHRCCQHNAGHGWPYYAQHLWYATPEGGLAAILYSESSVTAKVAGGSTVTIDQRTDYPFGGTVHLSISLDAPAKFPLALRIPGWCEGATVKVNGRAHSAKLVAGTLATIDRRWADGDAIELTLPMTVRVRAWEANHNAVSVDRGPLTYALDIGETWTRYEDAGAENKEITAAEAAALNTRWPAWQVGPARPWNYGLALGDDPGASVRVVREGPPADGVSPWTPDAVPVALEAPARLIPEWGLDMYGLAAPLQPSPAHTAAPLETVRLIPMGAARLRVSAFPTVAAGPSGNRWTAPRIPKRLYRATASHTHEADRVEAIADDIGPANSGDQKVARHTFWPRKGTLEWLQADFEQPREVSGVAVYWFDDRDSDGLCRVPASWRVLYRDGDQWKPVATSDEFTSERDQFNSVTFEAVKTDALRLEIQLQKDYSAGVLEWSID
jgi:DUF1680 family protein